MKYEEEIIDVIDDLYSRNKVISPKELSKVFYLLRDKYNISDYVELLLFTDEHEDSKLISAAYDNIGKYIMVYKKNISHNNQVLINYSELDKKTTRVYINFVIIGILIHELTHVRQLKYLLESNKYDNKYELVRHCLIDDFIENTWNMDYLNKYYGMDIKKYYGKKYAKYHKQIEKFNNNYFDFYDYDPMELQAEYMGRCETLKLSKCFKSDISKVISDNLNEERIDFIDASYKVNKFKILSPSEIFRFKYNNIITMDKIKKEEIFNSSLNLSNRVALGLPITRDEYHKLTNM